MEFPEIFQQFLERKNSLKTVFVASSDDFGRPNCAPKMLVDIVKPNKVFYVDFKFSRTFTNVHQNWQSSLSFMDDRNFTGFRLNGFSQVIDSGRDYQIIKEKWAQRVISHEADRLINRLKGIFSTHESEFTLPNDFVIIQFIAEEASLVKPDRVLNAIRKKHSHPVNKMDSIQALIEKFERTEKKHLKTEQELRFSGNFLQRAIDGINDPVMVIDTKYRVALANKTARDFACGASFKPGEHTCYKISNHCDSPCEENGKICALKEALRTKKSVTLVHKHVNAEGQEVYFEVSANPIFDDKEQVTQIVESCHDITDHVKAEKALEERRKAFEKKSNEDELTGLYNRRGFTVLVEQQLKLAKRNGKEAFLIFSDIDSLKPINDDLGHQMGDRALIESAEILKKTFRESDIIARIGGDEFAVAMIDCSREHLEVLKNRLRDRIAERNQNPKNSFILDMSLGVAPCAVGSPLELEKLLDRADQLMYDEKQFKKNRLEQIKL